MSKMPAKDKMTGVILKKQNLPKLVEKLTQLLTVYGPVAHKSQFRFDIITKGEQLCLNYDNTILPAKKYFFPPKQKTLTFSKSPTLDIHEAVTETSSESVWNGKTFLIFGVHSCDLAAIGFNDAILTQIYPDPFRTQHRAKGIIIGINCLIPCEDSFCKSADSLDTKEPADIMVTELEDAYFFEVITEIGQKIIEYAKPLFTPATGSVVETVNNKLRQREQDFPNLIKDFQNLPEQLEKSYEGEMWNRFGKRCFGCGACTLVCPTCFCFDVHDEVDLSLKNGARVRTWDSCQFVDFALVAGGHNFRPTMPSRVRFRIYHKFRAEPEQINQIGCIGCGRCTRTCPADIDMIELLTDIQKGGN